MAGPRAVQRLRGWRERSLKPRIARAAGTGCGGCAANDTPRRTVAAVKPRAPLRALVRAAVRRGAARRRAGHAQRARRHRPTVIGQLADACRIVSLAPGTTAMLYAAGAGHCLVGTIAHSKEPAEAASVPVVGDAETLDFEQLLALRPTVVVVAIDVVQRVRIDRIRALGIPVYQVHVTSLAQMPESLRRLGELTGTAATARDAAPALGAAARRHRRALSRARAAARALPDLGSAYLHHRRAPRDHRRAAHLRRHQRVRRPGDRGARGDA